MAEYFFYGTKNGLTALSTQTDHCGYPVEIRNNGEAFDLLGKQFYSLSFSQDGCFFSKYMFVNDTPRSSSSFGFLGVDVFVPSAKEIKNIKELLDALIDGYATSYIKENGMTSQLAQFSFADKLIGLNEYAETDRLIPECSFASGPTNSYIIYHSSDELKNILSEPYRPEYKKYKKIFLIDSGLNNQGALNVIKCDKDLNLTDKVDWKNLLYRVEISRTSKCDKMTLHRNENLLVTWEERYYVSATESGSLEDLVAKNLVEIDEAKRVVKILDKSLKKITKSIAVKVVDYNGSTLTKASVFYENKNKNEKKNVSGNMITLEGEDAESVSDFRLYVEGLTPDYKINKDGYLLRYPETIITLSREKKTSVNFSTPEIVFENDSLNKLIEVDVSAKIDDQTFVYNTQCRIEKFNDTIKLINQTGSTFNPTDSGKENKKARKSKKVDFKWLIVSSLSGVLLTICSFLLADFLDLNIFDTHKDHTHYQRTNAGDEKTDAKSGDEKSDDKSGEEK